MVAFGCNERRYLEHGWLSGSCFSHFAITRGASALPRTFNAVIGISISLYTPVIMATPSRGSPALLSVAVSKKIMKPGTLAAPFDVSIMVMIKSSWSNMGKWILYI